MLSFTLFSEFGENFLFEYVYCLILTIYKLPLSTISTFLNITYYANHSQLWDILSLMIVLDYSGFSFRVNIRTEQLLCSLLSF